MKTYYIIETPEHYYLDGVRPQASRRWIKSRVASSTFGTRGAAEVTAAKRVIDFSRPYRVVEIKVREIRRVLKKFPFKPI